MSWSFSQPKFDFFDKDFYFRTSWSGHYNFVYDLVSNLRPSRYVELGSHYGHSLYAAAQAVKDHKLPTEVYGVDGWEGDAHAGYYDGSVYNEVLGVLARHYSEIKITPKKMYFNQAAKDFVDKSIDILHIDGLHTYEAVKEDFETWLPKMADTGVVLFHDTIERQEGFGVWKLWEELEKKYPANINFQHSHGLGVLFLNGKIPWITDRRLIINHYEEMGTARSAFEEMYNNFLRGDLEKSELLALHYTRISRRLKKMESNKIYSLLGLARDALRTYQKKGFVILLESVQKRLFF